jgi:hypothetical protein
VRVYVPPQDRHAIPEGYGPFEATIIAHFDVGDLIHPSMIARLSGVRDLEGPNLVERVVLVKDRTPDRLGWTFVWAPLPMFRFMEVI